MQAGRQFPIWLRAALPLVLALLIGLSAQPFQLAQALRAAQQARENNDPAAEAHSLAIIAAWQPWRVAVWEDAGLKALRGDEPENAVQYLRAARSHQELSLQGYLALAEAYELTGDTQAAMEIWQGLVERSQAPADVYENLARLYWQQGQIEKALAVGQGWVNLDPKNAQAQFATGLLMIVEAPGQALPFLSQAKSLDESLGSRVDALTRAYQLSQQEQHAGYQKVILGRALGNLGYWQLAERVFAQGTALAPDYAEAWAFLGEARQQSGQDGYAELEKARSLDPGSVVTQSLSALYFRRQGKFEQSLALLKAVAHQEPDQPVWQVELGNTMLEMKDIDAALTYYQSAALINPSDAHYWTLLAEFCAVHQLSLREVGLPAARQALTLAPDDAPALDAMGQVLVGLDDLASAERFFQQAVQKDANLAAAHLHLAQVYLQAGQLPGAQVHLTQAYQLAGKQSAVRLVAQRLLERFFGAAP